jgi:hypothetical protein
VSLWCFCVGMEMGVVGSEDRPMKKGFLVRYQSEYQIFIWSIVVFAILQE